MKNKQNVIATLLGVINFFVLIAEVVFVALIVYIIVDKNSGGDKTTIAVVMLSVVLLLAFICTLGDYLRRKIMVGRPIKRILSATDKIAAGDFSVRLDITHPISRYNEYDYLMENINRMADELSRVEVLHTDFISNVSHEIKTPLLAIQNFSTYLQSEELDSATRITYAKQLNTAVTRLTGLITNILKLNKLENQETPSDYEEINLTETLAETLAEYEQLIADKGLNLECDIAEDDIKIVTCPSYLEIVWNNLISNAIKFTESGGTVKVSLASENGKAIVKVADTGCGMTADTGKRIFEKFYQGDTSHSQEGNGLGLALVKKVIDVLGGSISVESEVNKGTVFTITLQSVKQ